MSSVEKKEEYDEQALQTLLDMGYSEDIAKEALKKHPTNTDLAVEYIINKEEEDASAAKNNNNSATAGGKVVKSYICTDTGKVFRTMRDAMLYGERTGNTNFEESEVEVPPLTKEELAEKLAQINKKIAERRVERQEKEKAEEIEREKERRRGGQEMQEVREVMQKQKRQHEIEKEKREKEAEERERERLRIEIAKDKGERASKRAHERGEDPKAAYDKAYNAHMEKYTKKVEVSKTDQIDKIIDTIVEVNLVSVGFGQNLNQGKVLLETVKKMFQNVLDNPKEEKFRKIRLSNPGFDKKVGKSKSGIALFKGVGFEQITEDDNERYLALAEEHVDPELLTHALKKIDAVLPRL